MDDGFHGVFVMFLYDGLFALLSDFPVIKICLFHLYVTVTKLFPQSPLSEGGKKIAKHEFFHQRCRRTPVVYWSPSFVLPQFFRKVLSLPSSAHQDIVGFWFLL